MALLKKRMQTLSFPDHSAKSCDVSVTMIEKMVLNLYQYLAHPYDEVSWL